MSLTGDAYIPRPRSPPLEHRGGGPVAVAEPEELTRVAGHDSLKPKFGGVVGGPAASHVVDLGFRSGRVGLTTSV